MTRNGNGLLNKFNATIGHNEYFLKCFINYFKGPGQFWPRIPKMEAWLKHNTKVNYYTQSH